MDPAKLTDNATKQDLKRPIGDEKSSAVPNEGGDKSEIPPTKKQKNGESSVDANAKEVVVERTMTKEEAIAKFFEVRAKVEAAVLEGISHFANCADNQERDDDSSDDFSDDSDDEDLSHGSTYLN